MAAQQTTEARHAGLTRWRFALIAWVIVYHLDLPLHVSVTWPWLQPVLGRGYLGVDGFFLLSGFALWLGYGARPPRGAAGIGRFLLRRVAKIWPLHLLALLGLALVVGLAVAAGVRINDPDRFGARDFVLQLLLVNAWETTDRFAWNYPSWALSVEWAGYLAFPLVLAALLRLPRSAVALVPTLALAGLALLAALGGSAGGLNLTLHLGLLRFAAAFIGGLALGRLATEGRIPAILPRLGALALPLGLWAGYDPATVAGLACITLVIWQGGRTAPARPDLLLRLGEASFGIYLCWVFVEAAVVAGIRLLDPGPWGRVGLMGAGFLASLVAGWCAWRFVEMPAHRWIMRQFHERGAAPLILSPPRA